MSLFQEKSIKGSQLSFFYPFVPFHMRVPIHQHANKSTKGITQSKGVRQKAQRRASFLPFPQDKDKIILGY